MSDEELTEVRRRKGRSASVCFAGRAGLVSSDLPQPAPPSTPPHKTTHRPPVRTQSARLTAHSRTVRVREREQAAPTPPPLASGTSSDPRLHLDPTGSNSSSPNSFRRKGSSRRVNSVYNPQSRRSTALLDIPNNASPQQQDENSYRLRSFSFTTKQGIVNRGDSFRKRHNRSNSIKPSSAEHDAHLRDQHPKQKMEPMPATPQSPVSTYNVSVIGAPGVGKTSLISQFMTSEGINPYDRDKDGPSLQSVSIMLNGEESELCFHELKSQKAFQKRNTFDAFMVIYSVVDKSTFQQAEVEISRLQDSNALCTKPAILVGNKIDLARSRMVSSQDGKCLACTFRVKYTEISVAINHNVDELLVGILNQIRLKKQQAEQESGGSQWYKSRGVMKASMKARQMFTWIFGREDSKFKNCENLHIL